MISLLKTFSSSSLRRVGIYESLVIARSYHTKTNKSPFISLNKAPKITQNESKQPNLQKEKIQHALHMEISEICSKIENPSLSKWLDEQLKKSESRTIDCVFAVCFHGVQKGVTLNNYDQLKGFIDQQLKSLKERLDSSSELNQNAYLRQNLLLCTSFLLAHFNKIQGRNWNMSRFQEIFKILQNNLTNPKEERQLLKYLTYVVTHIDFSRRDKEITSNAHIVKEYLLLAAHSMEFYANEQVKIIKSQGFKLSHHSQSEMQMLNRLIEEILLETPKVSSRIMRGIEDFFSYQQFIWNATNNQANSGELAADTIITLARYFDKSREKGSVNKFFHLSVLTLEYTIENIEQFQISRFIYLCDTLSVFPVYKIHYSLYEDFWLAAIKYIIARKDQFLLMQWRALLYSIAKSGFVTPDFVKEVFLPKLDPEFYKQSKKNPDLYKCLVNLIQLGFRNKLLTLEDFDVYKRTLAELGEQQIYAGCEENMINMYLQLCTTMCRHEIYDFQLWKPFFDYFSKGVLPNHLKYRVWYIIKNFEIFGESAELSKQVKTKAGFEELRQKKEIKELMNSDSFGLEPGVEQVSLIKEYSLAYLLKEARIPFQQESRVGNMRVDYLLPDSKIIIERDGPDHYIKPAGEKNSITEYRETMLKKLGYTLIEIPGLGPDRNKVMMSSDLYFFNELNKYFNN